MAVDAEERCDSPSGMVSLGSRHLMAAAQKNLGLYGPRFLKDVLSALKLNACADIPPDHKAPRQTTIQLLAREPLRGVLRRPTLIGQRKAQ